MIKKLFVFVFCVCACLYLLMSASVPTKYMMGMYD